MIIHIGKGKTGTSFLQEEIFQSNNKINYIAKAEKEYPQWLIQWHYSDDILFNEIKEEILDKVNSLMSHDKINLISSEAFSIVGNLYQQVVRIKEIQPNAKILITLRDPIEAILSFYKYSVQCDKFIDSLENCIDYNRTPMVFYKRKPIYMPDFYYDEIINTYKVFFGVENVCVLKYEDMVENPDVYFKNLAEFIGFEIDLDIIKKKLNKKVNDSPCENDIDSLRIKNLLNLIAREFDNFEINVDRLKVRSTALMSQELRLKLIDILRGKCFGYY